MTTQSSAASAEAPKSKLNCFLWGCLAVVILFILTLCCLGTLIFLPLFTDYDPLGMDIRNRIEQYIPLDDSSEIPGMPEIFDDTLDPFSDDAPDASGSVDLTTYVAQDFPATFGYPSDWAIETEESGVTFYDTNSHTYLYVGEVFYDEEMTARQVAEEVLASLSEDVEEGSFVMFEEGPFIIPTGDDAYLIGFEFIDLEGYYQWVLDLETIRGGSNIYFFLSGEDPEDYHHYRELIEIIAASFSR